VHSETQPNEGKRRTPCEWMRRFGFSEPLGGWLLSTRSDRADLVLAARLLAVAAQVQDVDELPVTSQ